MPRLRNEHRSNAIARGRDPNTLTTRKHKIILKWDERYKRYLCNVGLYGVHQIGYILADKALVTALVERWKPTTHTFHLPIGEMTITLEDVAMLLGLPIDGSPICVETSKTICGVRLSNWPKLIHGYLGCEVDDGTFRPRSKTEIRIKWMKQKFHTCPDNANDQTVKCYARAYMLMLLGSLLFTNRSGNGISVTYLPFLIDLEPRRKYSWGSAVLACMYKELCKACREPTKQMGGPIILLQLWSWERFRAGRPTVRDGDIKPVLGGKEGDEEYEKPPVGFLWSGRHKFTDNTVRSLDNYRDVFDKLVQGEVYWQPYEQHRPLLPPICTESEHLWMTTAPLIHFRSKEAYSPGRVMRQFGLFQEFPPQATGPVHSFGCEGAANWGIKTCSRADVLNFWRGRDEHLILEDRDFDPTTLDEYIEWLKSITQVYLQPPAEISEKIGDTPLDELQYLPTEPTTRLVNNKVMEIARKTAERINGQVLDGDDMNGYLMDVLQGCGDVLRWLGVSIDANPAFALLQNEDQMEDDGEAFEDENQIEEDGEDSEDENQMEEDGEASDEDGDEAE